MSIDFDHAFDRLPLVAILRGLTPAEAEPIGNALVESGFTLIEVPLNSPDPLDSIARLSRRLAGRAIVGAGTVLSSDEVAEVKRAGGSLIVSPDCAPAVIEAAVAVGLVSIPGVATVTEAFIALRHGAHALKLFPAEASTPAALAAMRAVLPPATRILPVGGIDRDGLQAWRDGGASGFGLGSALYRPGRSAAEVRARAAGLAGAWRAAQGSALS
ncbi:2-dehydro-3-deoxy-6-phosphogalactonate aldolase [Sphingosinicella sp. LHD-64]|uniref:2-dehydro-3-deoxy-6-phosphogalactonate aldolase n=1 Tax=Sphingosinicella sp. LHD-64 TaxID=3072139 RepID=UPI00280FF000|nr:2-dehydro-3-deoxy-6-phosphogalactonate aldolase [Sphingosinicella sp. LHD-64]MDQ8757804.1 2-dehydro-3-deoxy-6-phosphogalactonate aldolase [Sphingosinicella sp. LHD-64]